MRRRIGLVLLISGLLFTAACAHPSVPFQQGIQHPLAGFAISPFYDEQVTSYTLEPEIHITINAPAPGQFHPLHPTLIVFYALPNGNTTAQTIGKRMYPGDDWHYDIQHIGAQTRRLRDVCTDRNIVVAYLEAGGRSWPGWRKKYAEKSGPRIVEAVESVKQRLLAAAPASSYSICLNGHSGGGSFVFGYLNQAQRIPDDVERIAFLDSNYGYSDDDRHGDILLEWLKRDPRNHLVVIAYDDREIMLDGKKVVGPTGGTWRATHRMIERFQRDGAVEESKDGDLVRFRGLDGQATFILHMNPENKILHTELVGPKNGFIYSVTLGTSWDNKAGAFNGPPAYLDWVQDAGPAEGGK